MAIGYVTNKNSYTALSTDDLSTITSTFSSLSHGIKLYITNTGEHLIYDNSVKSFIPDIDSETIFSIGAFGGKVITGTSAITPATGYYFYAIQVTSDIIVSTQGNVSGSTNPVLSSLTGGISAGTVIYGKFTSMTLSSGEAIGYYAKV